MEVAPPFLAPPFLIWYTDKDMFDGIIGHSRAREVLARSIENNRLNHAYLFLGPSEVGKEMLARAFAEELLRRDGTFTGSLETHPDFTLVGRLQDEETGKEKSEISVDQIRELRARLSQSALLPSFKIAIIRDAETLTTSAANAFLKTLEEPQGKTVIILLVRDLRRIPATIRSRAQLIRFRLVNVELIRRALLTQGLERSVTLRILSHTFGRPGRALHLASDPNELKKFENELALRERLVEGDLSLRMKWIESRLKGAKQADLTEEWSLWRRIFRERLIKQTNLATVKILKRIDEAEEAVRHHVDPRLAFEFFLIGSI